MQNIQAGARFAWFIGGVLCDKVGKDMSALIYKIQAFRFGSKGLHSYIVGIYIDKLEALKRAEYEEDFRGGKYECEVSEHEYDLIVVGAATTIIHPIGTLYKKINE
jgi:hypothetical protein